MPFTHHIYYIEIYMPKNNYWTLDVDKHIDKYNKTEDDFIRNQIFNTHIYKPLRTLCESVVRVNWYQSQKHHLQGKDDVGRLTDESVINDVMSFVITKLHLFNPNKSKGFSYFSVVARNYVWMTTNKEMNFNKGLIMNYNLEDVVSFNKVNIKKSVMRYMKISNLPDFVSNYRSQYLLNELKNQLIDKGLVFNTWALSRFSSSVQEKYEKIFNEFICLIDELESWSNLNLNKKNIFKRIKEKHDVNIKDIQYVHKQIMNQYNLLNKKLRVPQYDRQPH